MAALLPLLYLASTGPVAWWLQGQSPTPGWVEWVYYPVGWAWDHSPLFQSLLEKYLKLWGVH